MHIRERIEDIHQLRKYGSDEYRHEIKEILIMFADSIAKLQTQVNLLIAQNGAGDVATAVANAVAAKDAADAAAVDAVTATVAAAVVAPAAPAAPAAQ